MGDEPRNAASELARWSESRLNDRKFMVSDGLSLCTDDFVRYDRRRVTPQPPADRHGWLDAMLTFEELAGGRWPTFTHVRTVAVRGDRLTADHWTMGLGDVGELGFLVLSRTDEAIERTEVIYFFDPDDEVAAIAELDRLYTELDGRD